MKNDEELRAAGERIAQTYLLELLLVYMFHQADDPAGALDHARFQMRSQIEDDFFRNLGNGQESQSDSSRMKTAAVALLDEVFDRAASQFERPAPSLSRN
jgi:cell division protein FtsL